ncbi:(4Fe-4S)-binding protein [Chryseobacterium chendengshani]|uniref:(4Fe-4S)-binding protein n=1 Tax=Chryseobacterium sp. LJ668 TaxID=2864040 RepID=UPI00281512F4|nr:MULTISPECIES: (4Fe-4S)-binding protein [unclassified Chryseobacterium]
MHPCRCWCKKPAAGLHPKASPWLNCEHASVKDLKTQIEKCPSGALLYKES